jgi:glycosyltransferase involved in cell wall biosynthesis
MTAALRELGVEVEIATTDSDGPARLTPSDLPATAVPVHLFSGAGDLSGWLAARAREFDLIHTHSLWNPHTAAACRAARRAGVPYVVRPCGMLSEYTWARGWWKKRAYWWVVERRNVRGAAAVHATSEGERSDVLRCGVTAPVAVIPLGVEAAGLDTPPRPDWLRERCGSAAGGRPIVLFLSRLHPKKGVADYLLPAFARVKADAHLAVAGGVDDSTPEYAADVERAIRDLGLTGRVSLLGPVAPADRWAAYDGAAAFCLPSQSENFGIVVTEAMARGCPVVASDGVEAIQHVEAAKAGRKVALEVGAVAEALDGVLAESAAIGRRGRAYVEGNLRWPDIARLILDLYARCRRPACTS